MKYRNRSLALITMIAVMFISFTPVNIGLKADNTAKVTYTDVPEDHWAYEAIEALTKVNVVSGTGKGEFKPDSKVTRAQFITFIGRALNIETGSYRGVFKDVSKDAYYAKYVEAAEKEKIIKGGGGAKFNPNANISKEEIACIIAKAYSIAIGKSVDELSKDIKLEVDDAKNISNWAVQSVKVVYGLGIMDSEENSFKPKEKESRAQTAMAIYNMLVLLLPAEAIPTPAPTPIPTPVPAAGIFYDDSIMGNGLYQFEYVPQDNWGHPSYEISYSNLYGCGFSVSSTHDGRDNKADYFQFRFMGTQIKVYSAKILGGGKCFISIDGGEETLVNTYAENVGNQLNPMQIYESPVLAYGEHILKCKAAGKDYKEFGETKWNVAIDKVEVIGDPDAKQTEIMKKMYLVNANTGDGLYQFNYHNGTSGKINGLDATEWKQVDNWGIISHSIDRGAADAYATFKFEGTQVTLYAEKSSWGGIAAISVLDEKGNVIAEEKEVDCFFAERRYSGVKIYTSPVLEKGTYTLKVRVTGKYNEKNNNPDGERKWTINLWGALVASEGQIFK